MRALKLEMRQQKKTAERTQDRTEDLIRSHENVKDT